MTWYETLMACVTAVAVAYTAFVSKTTKTTVNETQGQVTQSQVTGDDNSAKLDDVHTLVNSRLDMVLGRVEQLCAVLEEHGITIPPEVSPSVKPMPRLGKQ